MFFLDLGETKVSSLVFLVFGGIFAKLDTKGR